MTADYKALLKNLTEFKLDTKIDVTAVLTDDQLKSFSAKYIDGSVIKQQTSQLFLNLMKSDMKEMMALDGPYSDVVNNAIFNKAIELLGINKSTKELTTENILEAIRCFKNNGTNLSYQDFTKINDGRADKELLRGLQNPQLADLDDFKRANAGQAPLDYSNLNDMRRTTNYSFNANLEPYEPEAPFNLDDSLTIADINTAGEWGNVPETPRTKPDNLPPGSPPLPKVVIPRRLAPIRPPLPPEVPGPGLPDSPPPPRPGLPVSPEESRDASFRSNPGSKESSLNNSRVITVVADGDTTARTVVDDALKSASFNDLNGTFLDSFGNSRVFDAGSYRGSTDASRRSFQSLPELNADGSSSSVSDTLGRSLSDRSNSSSHLNIFFGRPQEIQRVFSLARMTQLYKNLTPLQKGLVIGGSVFGGLSGVAFGVLQGQYHYLSHAGGGGGTLSSSTSTTAATPAITTPSATTPTTSSATTTLTATTTTTTTTVTTPTATTIAPLEPTPSPIPTMAPVPYQKTTTTESITAGGKVTLACLSQCLPKNFPFEPAEYNDVAAGVPTELVCSAANLSRTTAYDCNDYCASACMAGYDINGNIIHPDVGTPPKTWIWVIVAFLVVCVVGVVIFIMMQN